MGVDACIGQVGIGFEALLSDAAGSDRSVYVVVHRVLVADDRFELICFELHFNVVRCHFSSDVDELIVVGDVLDWSSEVETSKFNVASECPVFGEAGIKSGCSGAVNVCS